MVFLESDLRNYYHDIVNIHQKINSEIAKKRLYRMMRGVYTNDPDNDFLFIANKINRNSYISFDYALYYYDLIPERVSVITSATRNVRKKKTFVCGNRMYTYQDVNSRVFNEEVVCVVDANNNNIRIASKEKALCDKLSTINGIRTIKEIKRILFENLRIDGDDFVTLNFGTLIRLARLYNKTTLNVFAKLVERLSKNRFR